MQQCWGAATSPLLCTPLLFMQDFTPIGALQVPRNCSTASKRGCFLVKKKKKAQKKKEKNPNLAIPQSGLPAGCVCGAGWDCRWWELSF